MYNRIPRIYDLYSVSNLLARYRKITRSITRDIPVGVTNTQITLHFMVKYRNNSLNRLKSTPYSVYILFIYLRRRAIHISKI